MILADFVIRVAFEEHPREVRVIVYDSLKGLRIGASRYENKTLSKRRKKRDQFKTTLGICHRFEWFREDGSSHPQCAIVRLAHPYIGAGMITHELTHAIVWMRELNGDKEPLTCANDETFAWVMGEVVRQTINKFNEHKVYAKVDDVVDDDES